MSSEKQGQKKEELSAVLAMLWEDYEIAIGARLVCPRNQVPSPQRAAAREEIIRVFLNKEY